MVPRPRSVSLEWWEGVCGDKSRSKNANGKERAVVWVLSVGRNNDEEVEVEYFGNVDNENDHADADEGTSLPQTLSNSTTRTRNWHGRSQFQARTLIPTLSPRAVKETTRRVKWGRVPRDAEGEVILKWWFDHLSTLEEVRCVEVRGGPVFDQL
jgi:hypothetical protein